MKIMVFDVPAETGGALSILNQYYTAAIDDTNNQWFFVVSQPELETKNHIKVLRFPWVKKSWLHRLIFDQFFARKLVKQYQVDEVLSLQNITFPGVKVKQTLYLHQPLPFAEKRFKLTDNVKFWLYQNVISKMIFRSIRKADQVIVQTKWMIEAAASKAKVNSGKFVLQPPKLMVETKKLFVETSESRKLFFYPAGAYSYKNHDVIVNACKLLKDSGFLDYAVVFTLDGNENTHIGKLRTFVANESLPISFIGSIPQTEVFEHYSKSILLFPSFIETFGLPLLEAKMHEAPIIASDCAFSHEILDDYPKVSYFSATDPNQLRDRMLDFIG